MLDLYPAISAPAQGVFTLILRNRREIALDMAMDFSAHLMIPEFNHMRAIG